MSDKRLLPSTQGGIVLRWLIRQPSGIYCAMYCSRSPVWGRVVSGLSYRGTR